MKEYNWLLLATLMVGVVSAQKLFFKSNKLIQEEIEQHLQKAQPVKGFGFGEPRHYFTSHRKIEDLPLKVTDNVVVCPDKKTACPDGNTCCQTSPLGYGCCPLPMASCCPDKRHCCPTRTRCDQVRQACISGVVAIPWYEKTAGITLEQPKQDNTLFKVESVICPDGEHQCEDGQTCCKSAEGYSCCPLPHAVCCSDEVHCCPTNTTCDVAHGRCNKEITGEFVDWVEKVPKQKVKSQSLSKKLEPVNAARLSLIGSVNCDDKHVCPTGNTCCKMVNNEWGCCPKPEAECCEDKLHCCPKGSKCEPSSGNCVKGLERVPWLQKQPAIVLEVVKCDESHGCPTKNTCCKLSSGQWGCCPLPEAVCCSDGVHCCPSGTTCDVSSGKCNQAGTQIDWFMKQPAKEVGNVQCDSTHECPPENTCCKLSSGQWGCCPLPNAVCCSDGVHCCPSGTTCDVSSGKCNRGDIQLDWFVKTPAMENIQDVICPDGSECQDGQTCCEMNNGVNSYGCCPLPNAVCCNDGQHCCPHSYRCDIGAGACVKGIIKLPWIRTNRHHDNTQDTKNIEIVKNIENTVLNKETNLGVSGSNIFCTDGTKCPDGYSCCENGKGGYNCCPMPNGVCCDDHQHCCPHGYICDEEPGICRIPETNTASSNFIRKLGSKRGAPLS